MTTASQAGNRSAAAAVSRAGECCSCSPRAGGDQEQSTDLTGITPDGTALITTREAAMLSHEDEQRLAAIEQ